MGRCTEVARKANLSEILAKLPLETMAREVRYTVTGQTSETEELCGDDYDTVYVSFCPEAERWLGGFVERMDYSVDTAIKVERLGEVVDSEIEHSVQVAGVVCTTMLCNGSMVVRFYDSVSSIGGGKDDLSRAVRAANKRIELCQEYAGESARLTFIMQKMDGSFEIR